MMEQTLAERLLERFTPDELATVRAALARIEARAKATLDTPPKSSEPEKVPTPASDSAKGERDRHGRTIIARNDFAMVVECGSNKDDDGRFQISSACGTFWYVGQEGYWLRNHHPNTGVHTVEWCMKNLPQAATTPLPTANPAASAKPYAFNGPIPSGPSAAEFSDLRLRVGDLEREVAALKAVK